MLNNFDHTTLEQVILFVGLISLVFGAVAVAVCIGLIVHSDATLKIFEKVNVHVSTRTGFRVFSIYRDTSQLVIKHRHWLI